MCCDHQMHAPAPLPPRTQQAPYVAQARLRAVRGASGASSWRRHCRSEGRDWGYVRGSHASLRDPCALVTAAGRRVPTRPLAIIRNKYLAENMEHIGTKHTYGAS